MKDSLLIILGKETNNLLLGETTDQQNNNFYNGLFKSDCYYDWIKLENVSGKNDESEKCFEDLLVESYDKEVQIRQEAIKNDLHVQQGIIAVAADDEDEEEYNNFLNGVKNAGVIFISFIGIPSWSKEEKNNISNSKGIENVNESIKNVILDILTQSNESSMRLFYTFDHNDFVVICNGEKTNIQTYLNVLAEIKNITLGSNIFAIHDITTIYGYKNNIEPVESEDKINAILSVSGQDISFNNISHSFLTETIGRYDHLSVYENITWSQLTQISNILNKQIESKNIITYRIHIGCNGKYSKKNQEISRRQEPSQLSEKFNDVYIKKKENIQFNKLSDLYQKGNMYLTSIRVMLDEIGFTLKKTLERDFSKYNSICYIESYLCFLDYINEKIVAKFNFLSQSDNGNESKILAENLVNVSNSFFKSMLTLDSSIMHSERRFIISDPYQLSLFDVPPKLIAYYTAVASNMANQLGKDSENKYVFLITPDIKEDIYVESIPNS